MSRNFYIMFTIAATLSGLLIGYNTAIIAPVLPLLSQKLQLSTLMQETLVAAILVGAFIGAILSGHLTHGYGRKKILILSGVLFLFSALSLFLSEHIVLIFALRVMTGFAVGLASMVAPLYIAEVSPSRWRGACVSAIQLAITAGILFAYVMGYFFDQSDDWKKLLLFSALPALLLIMTIFFLPESPRWLVVQKRIFEATQILKMMGETNVEEELIKIERAAAVTGHWTELFIKKIRPVLLIASGLFVFQNLSGIDAVLYYSPTIFKLAGFASAQGALLATIFIGGINFLATILALWWVDRLGRRPLLLSGLIIMSLSLCSMAIGILFANGALWSQWLTLIALTIYIAAFAISLGPLPYVFMSELFPLHLRDTGMSIAAASAWGINVLVSITFLSLVEFMAISGVFLLYSFICILALIFCTLWVPETKGSVLEDIEANLTAGVKSRHLGSS